jgi:lipoprotein-releasing system permease protein
LSLSEVLRIALRYSLALGRGHLSVFMSLLSIAGLVLGTAVLLTVLSVMNGFDREMRERILALVPHFTVHTAPQQAAADAQAQRLTRLPFVTAVRPFVSFEAVAEHGGAVTVVSGLGLTKVPDALSATLQLPSLAELDGVILGDSVARRLGVQVGDRIRLVVPDARRPRASNIQSRRLRVSALVDTGTELDEALLLMPLVQAASLAGLDGGVSGLQLQVDDPYAVTGYQVALREALAPGSYATSWRMTHGNLYAAIQLSRDLVTLLLASIIGVAAFNVVSALVLVVIDKRGAIAILRTLGAVPGDMARIFLAQGLIIGLLGAALGCALGSLISLGLPGMLAALERALDFRFLSTDVYPVSFIPVDLRAGDALLIGVVSVGMCVLAALYPALRAARLQPAQVLGQDR